MTPELIIVKIQTLLASGGANQAQKRAVAMEYCSQCAQAQELLEHCAAMIRAGREYSALEFAESSSLPDKLNTLSFPEERLWAEYCEAADLPVPAPFDETLVEMVSSLYQKNISQTHPLYRDYRRAMRLRDFDKALAVITTISKINASDESAKEECARLRKNVAAKKIERLRQILAAPPEECDRAEFESICAFLERNDDFARDLPEWKEALKRRADIASQNLAGRSREILARLRGASVESDFDEIVSLLGELNSMPAGLEFSPDDAEFVDDLSKRALKIQGERLAREKSAKASAAIAREIERGRSPSTSARLKNLKRLRSECGAGLPPETARIADALISKISLSLFARKCAIACLAAAAAAGAAYLGFALRGEFARRGARAEFEKALNSIALIEEPQTMARAVGELGEAFKKFEGDLALKTKYEQLKNQADSMMANIGRLERLLDAAEKTDFANGPAKKVEAARKALDKVSDDAQMLPIAARTKIASRLEKIRACADSAISERQAKIYSQTRKMLAEYENILEQYESFAVEREKAEARLDSLSPRLRALMEDTTRLFRPQQIDVDKYNDISVRIKDARTKYAAFDDARKSLLSSKTLAEYAAAAKLLKETPSIPADFYKKLSKILARESEMKFGQLAEFAGAEAVECAPRVGEFARAAVKVSPFISDVYAYTRESGKQIYALGKAQERENKWSTGAETMQKVNEILDTGGTNQTLYRRHHVFGKIATGEKLSGGDKTEESKFAEEVLNAAAQDSLLGALELAASGKTNPVLKMLLEKAIFDEMRKNPIFSGLEYSASALGRAALIDKYSRGFAAHSWIFEDGPRRNFIERELYSAPLPDLKREAKICLACIADARKNPLKMVGIVGENGKKIVFMESSGRAWAVNKSGAFAAMAESVEALENAAELSPIFAETKSSGAIKADAERSLK